MTSHSQSDQKNDLSIASDAHTISISTPSVLMHNTHDSKRKIEELFDTINFLQRYSVYIDAVIHRINVACTNGYKDSFETSNEFLSRISGLNLKSISYVTKTLELSFDQKLQSDQINNHNQGSNEKLDTDDKTKTKDESNIINFTLDWTQNVEQNISCLLRNIYRIKKIKMTDAITTTEKYSSVKDKS